MRPDQVDLAELLLGDVHRGRAHRASLLIAHAQGQPFVVSPLLGQAVDASITTQTKKAQTWTLILGIPGAIFLLCGMSGAVISLVRLLMSK